MLDGVSKQLASLFEIVAGIKQGFDLPAVRRTFLDLVKIAIVRAANCQFLRRTKETSSLSHSKGPRVSSSRKKKSPAILNTSGTLDRRHGVVGGWGVWRPSDSTNPLGAIPFPFVFPHVPSTTHGGGSGG
jgi:hypothetical protein